MSRSEAASIAEVRRFNRFYTRRIGVLAEGYLRSPYSLAQARVLYELAQRREATATELGLELGLDAGYLSRILAGFERAGLLERRPSPDDARRRLLALTPRGRRAFATLDAASHAEIGQLIAPLGSEERSRLVEAMRTIEAVLGAGAARSAGFRLRAPRPGDMGWVVARHGALYAREYGFDASFEALVAEIVARFVRELDPARERCFIAESGGENVGSVFVVKHPERPGVARLRLLIVEPRARGLGIGKRLVAECTRFATAAGYHTLTLWTNSVLHAACHLYEAEGYRLVAEEPHTSFGQDLVGQTWELSLPAPPRGSRTGSAPRRARSAPRSRRGSASAGGRG